MKKLKTVNYFLNRLGIELIKYNPRNNALLRRKIFFEQNKYDLVIDVGANIGSFGKELRDIGYKGMIYSFEPIKDIYVKLVDITKNDKNWQVYNYALGAIEEKRSINISANSHSSSILNIIATHTEADPSSKVIGQESIDVIPLDNIFPEYFRNYKNIFLKIDTQGFEYDVLVGCQKYLSNINTLQIEMSLIPLYSGQVLFDELYHYVTNKNFTLINIEPGFAQPQTGQLLQVDCIFRHL